MYRLPCKELLSCELLANPAVVRIQYKCLVPIYVFPQMILLIPKQNYNVLSPSSYNHISVRDLYIYYSAARNMCTDPGNIFIAHRHMNVEIGTEATQYPEKEYILEMGFSLQCGTPCIVRQLPGTTCHRFCQQQGASAVYMLHLWFSFGYLDTCQAAVLSLLNEGHLDRMLRNLNKIIILS
jgi:hypothetical protein